ncbi:hypothetical protein [Megasphaera elsdenii]|uniref:hypothetical protein n=1 Tax=Megasphaera elsdenii TaxID=907 RepID=UPI0033964B36
MKEIPAFPFFFSRKEPVQHTHSQGFPKFRTFFQIEPALHQQKKACARNSAQALFEIFLQPMYLEGEYEFSSRLFFRIIGIGLIRLPLRAKALVDVE